MAHFKPFFYVDKAIDRDEWKRIFVEPADNGVRMEIIGNRMDAVDIFMPTQKFLSFADHCMDAADILTQDEDWVGTEI